MNVKIYRAMMEAYRRYKCFTKWADGTHKTLADPKDVQDAIDAGLLTPHSCHSPSRVDAYWYTVTDKGYRLFREWEDLGIRTKGHEIDMGGKFDTYNRARSIKIEKL